MSTLMTEEDLLKWTGYAQRSKLESWLLQNKIKFTFGKGNKIITTSDALDKAISGSTINAANDTDGFF